MPDRRKLRVGDRIRLLTVPLHDHEQREREVQAGHPDAGWTANTIDQIIAVAPEVVIYEIDEFGAPWFEVKFRNEPEIGRAHV